jgi:DnaK suppressor protein
MEKNKLESIRTRLLAEKDELLNSLNNIGKKSTRNNNPGDFDAEYPQYGDKDDDNATEIATYSDELSLESELEEMIGNIDMALKKIDNNIYGQCEVCKNEIGDERLTALPTARLCIDCKKKKL